MMNMNEHDTTVLIRSLLSAIKHHENMNAALSKEVERLMKDASYYTKMYEDQKRLTIKAQEENLLLKKQLQVSKPKRGRGRPRKVQP